MQHDRMHALESAVRERLEAIVDPCSVASGAPAGLVSMGLVGEVRVKAGEAGDEVKVTLRITEPGCMMGALFQLTAQKNLSKLPGVASVQVDMDYAHVWGPEQMSPEYRQRLATRRSQRAALEANIRETKVAGGLKCLKQD
jgi:metal-sulfur cluster biosynthetic enzyme